MDNEFDQFDPVIANPFDQFDPQKSDPNDVAKSYAGGIERGGAAGGMLLPNILNTAALGPQLLGRGIAENVDKAIGIEPQPRGNIWQPFYGSEEALKTLPDALQPHEPTTTAGKVADFSGQVLGNVLGGASINKAADIFGQGNQTITSQDIRLKASDAFKKADAAGGILKPNITNSFIDDATNQALPTSQRVRALVGDSPSAQIIQKLQSWRNTPMSLQETQDLDKHIGDLIDNHVDPKTGVVNAEGNNLLKIQHALRNSWENATPNDTIGGTAGFDASKEGRQLWAAAAKTNDIERILTRANLMDNPAQGIKTGFRNMVANPSRLRGYTQDEIDAINNAAKTGFVSNTLKLASSGLVPIISTITGGAEGGGAGLMVSSAAKSLSEKMQMEKSGDVLSAILNRPVVQNAFNPINKQPALPGYDLQRALAAMMIGKQAQNNAMPFSLGGQ